MRARPMETCFRLVMLSLSYFVTLSFLIWENRHIKKEWMNWKYQTLLHTFSAIDFCLGLTQANEAPVCQAIKTTCSLCPKIQKKIQKRSSVL
mmetsp:Transcript_9120/g.12248  ORF Transcript_9120/g.12248 Transcript_9120/m.12248 type:complete len:92 (+) Transcript_9120:879-1154(+)